MLKDKSSDHIDNNAFLVKQHTIMYIALDNPKRGIETFIFFCPRNTFMQFIIIMEIFAIFQ